MFIRYNSGSFLTMASLGLMMVSAIFGQDDTISITTALQLNHPLLYSNDEVRVQCNGGSFGDQALIDFGLIFQGLQENNRNFLCATAAENLALLLSANLPIDSISPASDSDCQEMQQKGPFVFVFKPHQAGLTYWCYMEDGTFRRSRNETLPATIHELPTDAQLMTDRDNYYEGSTVTATCNVTGGVPTTATYQYRLPTDTLLVTDGDNYYEGSTVTATCTVTGGAPATTTYQCSFGGQIFNSTGSWMFEANRTMTGDITCTSTEHLLYRDRSQPGLVGSKTINIYWLPTDTQLVTDRDNYYEGWDVTATCTVTGGVPITTTYQYSFNGQNFTSTGTWTFEANRTMTGDIKCTSTEHLLYSDRSQPGLVASKSINIYWLPTDTQLATDRDNYYEGWNMTVTCNVTGGFPETTTYQYSFGGQTFNSTGLSSWTFQANRTMTGDITCTSTEHLLYRDRSQPGLVGSKNISIYYIDLTPAARGGVRRELNPGYNNSVDCQDFLDTNLPTSDLSYSWTRDDEIVTNEATLCLPKNEMNGTLLYTCDITGRKFRESDPEKTRHVVLNVTWSIDAAPYTTAPTTTIAPSSSIPPTTPPPPGLIIIIVVLYRLRCL